MEIRITTTQVLKIMQVFSWIIFIGLCVEAGGFIFNLLFTLFRNPIAAKSFWMGMDLSALYQYDTGYFTTTVVLMVIVALLKALLFYLIVKTFHDKKIDLLHPFTPSMGRFIANLSYLCVGISIISKWGTGTVRWLTKQEVQMPDIQDLRLGGSDVWLLMGVTLFVIAQIFKRGIEIQSENDLTV